MHKVDRPLDDASGVARNPTPLREHRCRVFFCNLLIVKKKVLSFPWSTGSHMDCAETATYASDDALNAGSLLQHWRKVL